MLSLGDSPAQTPKVPRDEYFDELFVAVGSKFDVEGQRKAVLESLYGPASP